MVDRHSLALIFLLALPAAAGAGDSVQASRYLQMGKDVFEKGQYSAALEYFLSTLEFSPENVEAKVYIARIGEQWRQQEEQASLTPDERRTALRMAHALLEARRKRFSEMSSELDEVRRQLDSKSSDPQGLLRASRSLTRLRDERLGDLIIAEQSRHYIKLLQERLKQVIVRGGGFQDPKDLHVARGFLWLYKEDLARALVEWRRALALAPEDAMLKEQIQWLSQKKTAQEREQTIGELLAQARAGAAKSDYKRALLHWRSLVAISPENEEFQRELFQTQERVRRLQTEERLVRARRAMRGGKQADTSLLFLEVLEVDPANREALDSLKTIQQELNRRLAGSRLSPASGTAASSSGGEVRSPKLAEEQYTLGVIYYAQGEYEKSEKALKKAIELDPANEKAKNALSRVRVEIAP